MKHQKKNYRSIKLAKLIKILLLSFINKGKIFDPRLTNINFTITKVQVSCDLKFAYCYFIPFKKNITYKELLEAFNNNKIYLRFLLAKELNIKSIPELKFFYDYGEINAQQVNKILNNINKNY